MRSLDVSSSHVLLVDDEAPIRRILARWLEPLGYKTAEADCAEAALEAMAADPAAVVFCDVQMPGQGGLWLTGVLRERFPQTAIILATGVTTVPGNMSMRHGVLAYITKPFEEPLVRKAIETAMTWHDAAVAAGPQPASSKDEDADLQAWLNSI